jgi:hypothetical protein
MSKTRKNSDTCYVVYGNGSFNPIKIRGQSEKNALLERIKKQGFNPRYSLLSAKTCSRKGTIYNKIKGAVTIK